MRKGIGPQIFKSFYVCTPLENFFFDPFYGLYFSHQPTHITNYNVSLVGPLWAASMYYIKLLALGNNKTDLSNKVIPGRTT